MIVVLPQWIVADGEVPIPFDGMVLGSSGLRATCLEITETAAETSGVQAVPPSGPSAGAAKYELQGRAGAARDFYIDVGAGAARRAGSEFVLDVGDFQVLASTTMPASAITTGSWVRAECTLSVIADYEWEGFDLPDLRAEWLVREVHVDVAGDYLLDLVEPPKAEGR